MSTTIDERVLEMRFDNRQFESNVSTTMSTLDRLKQKLHFPGATKGLDDISSAAKRVDLSNIGDSAGNVGLKFNALYSIADQAFRNITNSAMMYGKKIVSALAIDPITTGLKEYETKMNAIQVMKSNTRSKYENEADQMADIEKALYDLNDYADRTVYNYAQMTDNMGKFITQGLGIDEAKNAIIGMANLAGASGASATDMARATYQMSQALGGVIRKIDWNSLRNANMASVELKNTLMDLARVEGIDIDGMIAEKGTFEETLEKGWLTGELFTKAMNIYSDTYSEAELAAMGFGEEQIKNFKSLAATAKEATTEVKTFSQLWDVLKETAQSGWTQTWEAMFGDFNTAKRLFTDLQNYFSDIINKFSDARNFVVNGALNFAKPWTEITDKLESVTKIADTVKTVTGTLEYFQEVVDRVWMGDFNNWGDTPDRRDLLTAAGYDHRVVQYLVNLGEEAWHSGQVYKLSIEEVEAAHKKYGLTLETTAEETEKTVIAFNELTDQKLKDAGLTQDEIELYRALEAEASRLGISVDELADKMSTTSGRTLIIESVKNAWNGLLEVLNVVKTAFVEIFNPPTKGEIIIKLYTIIDAIHEFSKSLTIVDKETGELNSTGDKLMRTWKGVFAAIDIVATILGGGLKIALKIITQLLDIFGYNTLDITAFIGDALVAFRDWIDNILDFRAILEPVAAAISTVAEAWRNWISKLKESENLPKDIAEGIASGFGKAWKAVINFFKNLPDLIRNGFSGAEDSPIMGFVKSLIGGLRIAGQTIVELGKIVLEKVNKFLSAHGFKEISLDSIAGLIQGFKEGASNAWDAAVEVVKNIVERVKEFLGIHSPSTTFKEIATNMIDGLLVGIKEAAPKVWAAIKNVFSSILTWISNMNIGELLAGVTGIIIAKTVANMGKSATGLVDSFAKIGDSISGLGDGLKDVLKSVVGMFDSISDSYKATVWQKRAKAIKNMAIAIGILALSVWLLAKIEAGKLWGAIGAIAALAGIMVLLSVAVDKLGTKNFTNIGKFALALLAMSASVLILAFALNKLTGISWDELAVAGTALLGLAGIVTGLVATTKLAGSSLDKVGGTLLKMSLAILLLVVVVKLVSGIDQGALVKGGLAILAFGGIFAALTFILDKVGPNIDKVGGTLLKMALSMVLMTLVTKMLSKMNTEAITKGLVVMTAFGAIITGLIAATKLAGPNLKGLGSTMLGISIAMLLMAFVVKTIGGIDTEQLIKGMLAVTAFGGIITGLMAATKLAGPNLKRLGTTMIFVSVAIAAMAVTSALLGMLSIEHLAKGVIAVALLGGVIAGLIASTKLAGDKMIGMGVGIALLAVAIGTLGVVVALLGSLDTKTLAKGIVVVTLLGGVITGLIAATQLAKGDIKGIGLNLVLIASAVAILGATIALLSYIDGSKLAGAVAALTAVTGVFAVLVAVAGNTNVDVKSLLLMMGTMVLLAGIIYLLSTLESNSAISSAAALSILMLSMSGCLVILSAVGKSAKDALLGVLALTTMAVPLIAFVGVMAVMQNVDVALGNIIALTAVATAMTILLVPLTIIGAFGTSGAPYLGALALLTMAVPLIAFVGVLACMQNVQNALQNATILIVLATAMTALLIPLTVIGALGLLGVPYLGVLALLAMAVPLIAFVGILAVMQNIQNATQNVTLLITLTTAMTGVLTTLSIIAPMAMLGVYALAALTALMVGIGGLVVAVGALMTEFPALQQFLNVGIPVLVQLAGGLGQIIGSFIAGFTGAVMTILPQLGLCLSQFMTNAMPFIVGAKMVDAKVLVGVGILAAAVIALTAVDLISGVAAFLQGGSSFASLGTELSLFMTNAMPFIMGARMISEEMVSGVKALAETILILTAADIISGLTSFFTGSSSLERFASQLPLLGTGLAGFIQNIGEDFSPDKIATINCAADAIKTLAQASTEIPNAGGLLGALVGNNDLGVFASQFPVLGFGLAQFLANIGTFTDAQVATVNCAAEAIKTLAAASSEIPNAGGLIGAIVGENDLGTFAAQFPLLGSGLAGFLTNVGTFTDEQVATVNCAAEAIKTLASAASEIPNSGGWIGAIVGNNDLGTFASQFPLLGTGLAGFLTNVGTFSEDQISTVTCAAQAVKTLAEVASTIPNEGGWVSKIIGDNNLSTFASHFPSLGEGLSGFASKLGTFAPAQLVAVKTGISAILALADLANADLKGAVKRLSDFGTDLPDFAANLGDFCKSMPSGELTKNAVSNLKSILSAIASIANVDSGPLVTLSKNLKKVGSEAVKKFVEAFTSDAAKTDVKNAAKKLGDKVVDGIDDKEKAIKTAGTDAAKKAVSGVETQKNDMKSAGKDLGKGLVQGIEAKWDDAYDAGYTLGQKAVQGEKDGQQSKSPSKLTIQAGKWLGEGLVIGMGKMATSVYDAGRGLGKAATGSLSSAISRISDAINTDIDAQPTIRPVLDLSDVRSGAGVIGNLLGGEASVGVMSNVSGISSMMNRRSQNGSNSDVIMALDRLGKKMDNINNASYHIDGVTYDDGSNIADAVKTIARAVKMERRV